MLLYIYCVLRLWSRVPRPQSLVHGPLCPAHVNIVSERDTSTGRLLDYKEVPLSTDCTLPLCVCVYIRLN